MTKRDALAPCGLRRFSISAGVLFAVSMACVWAAPAPPAVSVAPPARAVSSDAAVSAATPAGAVSSPSARTVGTASSAPGDDGTQWLRAGRDFANTRFSPLARIDAGNVSRLRLAWSFSDGTLAGHEGPPLVVGSTMYLVTPFPDRVYALDLARPGAPIKWSYSPAPTPVAIGKACCDTVNRGPAYADGKLVFNLLDDHTVALDAQTGKLLWRSKMGNVARGETLSMAPLVVGDKVLVGNSGDRFGVRGWIAALDLADGHEVWRAYSTGTDAQVRIGKEFKPYYDWLVGKDLGESSWPADMAATGGGAVDGWLSYDPELKLVFHGTGSPAPRVPEQRRGANLWTSALFARDPRTGMARWAYPFSTHDRFGYGGSNESTLLDLPIEGRTRQVLVQFNPNGFVYVIDRSDGQVLSATPYASQNWASRIDLASGKPELLSPRDPRAGVEVRDVCPSDLGAKGLQMSAYSPRTGLLYAGISNVCMDVIQHPQGYIAGTPYDGMEVRYHPAQGQDWGELLAWDPVARKKRWSVPEKFMTASGALATAGDLVFYGTADGWFRALDARSGQVLWSHKLGSGIIGQPISFAGPDGRQYVAVAAGVGGAAMANASVAGFPARGGTLYVFSIDGAGPGDGAQASAASGAAGTPKAQP